ncbi:MAG: hypothetical protein ACXQTR_05825 [Candidatus Methanospirareceae archaeon]
MINLVVKQYFRDLLSEIETELIEDLFLIVMIINLLIIMGSQL